MKLTKITLLGALVLTNWINCSVSLHTEQEKERFRYTKNVEQIFAKFKKITQCVFRKSGCDAKERKKIILQGLAVIGSVLLLGGGYWIYKAGGPRRRIAELEKRANKLSGVLDQHMRRSSDVREIREGFVLSLKDAIKQLVISKTQRARQALDEKRELDARQLLDEVQRHINDLTADLGVEKAEYRYMGLRQAVETKLGAPSLKEVFYTDLERTKQLFSNQEYKQARSEINRLLKEKPAQSKRIVYGLLQMAEKSYRGRDPEQAQEILDVVQRLIY